MLRRDFLAILAGSPLVFGLRELLAQEAAPDYFTNALKRMKETRRFGVVLVIPSDKDAQKRLGEGLLARLATGSKAGSVGFEIFCANVLICLSETKARDISDGKPAGEGVLRILLNPEGKKVAADRVKLATLENFGLFRESFTKFINGEDGARLRDHALAIEKVMPEDLKQAVARLVGEPEEARAAMDVLKSKADTIAPWLVQKMSEKSGAPFRAVLWGYYLEQAGKDPEPCLPFGVKVERVAVDDPCPPCGMAAYRGSAYRFLSFYEK
ncbi:MAG TPA: hypothetical protein VGK61_06920 [Planctomycetota bacterium]